jgi:hypothetical protein
MKKKLLTALLVYLLSLSTASATDLPMVLCYDSIKDGCNNGIILNSKNNTARWTDFWQGSSGSCPKGRINANDIVDLISCDGSIGIPIDAGKPLRTSTGIPKSVIEEVRDCFFTYDPPRIINITLPVVHCNKNETCASTVGILRRAIVWVSGSSPGTTDVPVEILKADGFETEWYGGDIDDETERWQSFVNHFNIIDVNGEKPIMVEKKSIYFKQGCSFISPPSLLPIL